MKDQLKDQAMNQMTGHKSNKVIRGKREDRISKEPETVSEYSDKIILVHKPLLWTSAHTLNVLKREWRIRKAGHAGTLDPMAEGLLVVCTGKMTKKITSFLDADKEYEGIIRIGARTESFDTETEEMDIVDTAGISDAQIEHARKKFTGDILQMPPMHSALKYKGKPLYKLARKGKEIKREHRAVNISIFETVRISENEIHFRIVCSKGTYIRSIANDFGNELGVGGYLKYLKRTRVGEFSLENLDSKSGEVNYRIS